MFFLQWIENNKKKYYEKSIIFGFVFIFQKKITSRILRTLLISYSYFVFFSEGLKIFHCNLNSKVENLYSTYNWESSQESHCSSNSRELIFPLSSLVFCNFIKLWGLEGNLYIVKFRGILIIWKTFVKLIFMKKKLPLYVIGNS